MRRLLMLVPIIAFEAAKAASYDECILAHMAGARNDTAIVSIQTACTHQAEEPLPVSVLRALNGGTLAGYHPPMGFFMTVENRTTYSVTRLQIQVMTEILIALLNA